MAHTPGPWIVDGTKGLGAYGVWTEYATHPGHDGAGYPSMVCSVYPNNISDLPRDQRDANARLISAAPCLLAACEALAEWSQHVTRDGTGGRSLPEIKKIAFEAIRKAKGA